MALKIVIYQLLVRLFGNKNTNNIFYGSIRENGCGKFNDINNAALCELKRMGITHIWYTGIIEHATTTNYSAFGISADNPYVVKGKAGSPYAIKDYYDTDPDLASQPNSRMSEFEALIERTHKSGLKAIIDFVPNHVARTYKSDVKPNGTEDLGESDNTNVFFHKDNNFYYIPGESFKVPENYNPCGDNYLHPPKNNKFDEYPAKASGNNVFTASPKIDDWFETVKLNYGIDYSTGTTHYQPIPDTWHKMLDILLFWANKGIDGLRCDMCEMVPAEFWRYAITEVKKQYRNIIFIGEAYSPENYRKYILSGFDYLYDKSGLYDLLRAAITGYSGLDKLQDYFNSAIKGIEQHMLTFLENHDEQRFASPQFAGSPEKAIPLMTLVATLHPAPVMIYFGQEIGVTAAGATGFSGDDGRTSIFDYTSIPEIQQWANNGKFDGALLSPKQIELRNFYVKLLNLCNSEEAIKNGKFGNLFNSNANGQSQGFNQYMNYAFTRYTPTDKLIIFITIDADNSPNLYLKIPEELFTDMGLYKNLHYVAKDILYSNYKTVIQGEDLIANGLHIVADKMSALILKLEISNI
ncbi:MAG: alpha-amylase family protein [Prevotellaceae bacterium]|nr:alpha-amylase family protein [Prevotellaceae bacterium]